MWVWKRANKKDIFWELTTLVGLLGVCKKIGKKRYARRKFLKRGCFLKRVVYKWQDKAKSSVAFERDLHISVAPNGNAKSTGLRHEQVVHMPKYGKISLVRAIAYLSQGLPITSSQRLLGWTTTFGTRVENPEVQQGKAGAEEEVRKGTQICLVWHLMWGSTMAECMSDRVSEFVSDRMAGCMSDRMAEFLPHRRPGCMSDRMSEFCAT